MAKQPPKWRKLLLAFISQLRILSKEESVRPGDRGTKIELWDSQQRILDGMVAGMDDGIRKFFVLKSRQLGSTTIFVIIGLFWLSMHPKMKGALVVDQDKTRDTFRETIRSMIESIPAEYGAMRIAKGGDNKYFMKFTNGSQLDFLVAGTSGSKEAWGESSGYSYVHLTEIASYGSAQGLRNFEEAMSENNPDRLYIYESTAKGYNHWRDKWVAAREDPYTSRCIFVGWWSKPQNTLPRTDPRFAVFGLQSPDQREHELMVHVKEVYGVTITPMQLAWMRYRLSDRAQTESSLNQNQPWTESHAFVMTGLSYFQTRRIANDMDRMSAVAYQGYRFWMGNDFWSTSIEALGGDEKRRKEIQLRMWHPPQPPNQNTTEASYYIGVDPAGGSDDKNDRHVVSVWRGYADKFVQVAEYADNIAETKHCAWVLAYLAGIYRNCVVNLELSGGYGQAVMSELQHLRELLRADINAEKRGPKGQDWTDFLSNARYYIFRRPDNPGAQGYVINWNTTGDNKNTIFSEFRDSHVSEALIVNSKPLLEEMMIIVQDGSRIAAPGNQKDDRTVGACLAHHAWVEEGRPGMIMRGETYPRVTGEEQGVRTGGHLVDRIVAKTMAENFALINNGVGEMTQERAWASDRGIA